MKMGTLKNIRIWLGWQAWKHESIDLVILGTFLLILLFSSAPFFVGGMSFGYQVPLKTLFFISLIAIGIILWAVSYAAPKKNFRVAVDKGKQIVATGKDLGAISLDVLKKLILEAEWMHDSAFLVDWLESWQRLELIKKQLPGLEEDLRKMAREVNSIKSEMAVLSIKLMEPME